MRNPHRPRPASTIDEPFGAGDRRLGRLRRLAWFLDRSISAGGNRRFGLDPIVGLIPGVGDWIASLVSLYILYEGARLGLGWRVLGRMAGNIALEATVGAVPIVGDVFDFAWQANARNFRLIEQNYRPDLAGRPLGRVALLVLSAALLLVLLLGVAAFLLLRWLWALLNGAQ